MKVICFLLFSVIGLESQMESSRCVQDIASEIGIVMGSAGLKPSNVKVRNYHYRLMSELSIYKVIHARRYISQAKSYVDCVVYEFEDNQVSCQTLNMIAESKHLDTMFKDYNFLFQVENMLVLIKTGCDQTPKLWEAINKEFESRKMISEGKVIRCICGGYCEIQ